MSVLQLNLKIIRRSLIYKLYVLLVGFGFCFLIAVRAIDPSINSINYSIDLLDLAYLEIVLYILSFSMAIYFSRMSLALEQSCALQRDCLLSRFSAVLLSSLFVTIFPILYAIIQSIGQKQTALFFVLSIVWILLKWPVIILFSQSLGLLVGVLGQSVLSYLVVVPATLIFSSLNTGFFSALPKLDRNIKEIVSSLMSLQDPFQRGVTLDFVGARVDLLSIVHVIFFVFLSIAFITAALFYLTSVKKKKVILGIAIILLYICAYFSADWYESLFPVRYSTSEKLFSSAQSSCSIERIDGHVSLNNISKFKFKVFVNKKKNEPIEFRLDNAFDKIKISYNNFDLDFVRQDDIIYIEDSDILGLSQVDICVEYSGRIYYVSNTDNIDIFSTKWYSALPPGYAFLPSNIDRQDFTSYHLNVNSTNDIASNLDVCKTGTNSYLLEGTSNSVCIFSGFLSKTIIDGIECIHSSSNTRTDFADLLNKVQNTEKILSLTDGKLVFLDGNNLSNVQKVMMIYFFYDSGGFPVLFDDYIVVNYGYTT